MLKLHRKRVKPVGAPPGTLVHTGVKRADEVRITVIDYDSETYEEREIADIEECFGHLDSPTITWVNIDGLHEVEILEKLGNRLDIHALVLEDVLYVDQRPKVEDLDEYIFIALKMLTRGSDGEVEAENISLILGPNWVISFQERTGDIFDEVRARLRRVKGRIRSLGADYLCYRLVDSIVDHYYLLLDETALRIESIESEVESEPTPDTQHGIYRLKHELLFFRKNVWPLREAIRELELCDSDLLTAEVRRFLSDVRDHTFQVIDVLDAYREMTAGMQDLYLSVISNRMNEVMKVLTIIATIFIPLTFIAGIYGMNFSYMPELAWRPAYFITLGVMAVIAVVMVAFFRRRKWF
jgi:magnesium transporter